jgi:hypothetical protein
MVTLRRGVGGLVAVLLVSGAALAQAPTPTELAELRVDAQAGDADAQCNLGVFYAAGWGIPQDHVEAVSWYRKAAEQGHADAQFFLGFAYYTGQGIPQNYAQAVTWYRQAAAQGQETAQSRLGTAYRFGEGVPQDYVEAHKWFNLVASRASFAESRKLYAESRDAVAEKMTPQQIADAQQRATEWLAAFEQRN